MSKVEMLHQCDDLWRPVEGPRYSLHLVDDEADERDVCAMAGGDEDALGRLYDRYASRMLAVGERILRSRREAEDILHDVFVEAWRQAVDYDPRRGKVRTWLLLRMRSRCLDRVRSAGYSRSRPLPARDDLLGSTMPPSSEDVPKLQRALAELPPEQRNVLWLGYFEGLSSAEIAAREGLPVGTVKSRAAAALQKLREAFREPKGPGRSDPDG